MKALFVAPYENALQHSWKKRTREMMSSCEDIKQFCLLLKKYIFGRRVYFFAGRDFKVDVALCSREAPVENYLGSFFNHRPLPECIISILPKMDGNFLHDLLAASVRAGRGLSSGPLAFLLTCSWVLVNIQGALTWKAVFGSRTKVPSSPKKLEVVIFQERLANLPRPCKCNRCSWLPCFCCGAPLCFAVTGPGRLGPICVYLTAQKWQMMARAKRRLHLNTAQVNGVDGWMLNHCQGNEWYNIIRQQGTVKIKCRMS